MKKIFSLTELLVGGGGIGGLSQCPNFMKYFYFESTPNLPHLLNSGKVYTGIYTVLSDFVAILLHFKIQIVIKYKNLNKKYLSINKAYN